MEGRAASVKFSRRQRRCQLEMNETVWFLRLVPLALLWVRRAVILIVFQPIRDTAKKRNCVVNIACSDLKVSSMAYFLSCLIDCDLFHCLLSDPLDPLHLSGDRSPLCLLLKVILFQHQRLSTHRTHIRVVHSFIKALNRKEPALMNYLRPLTVRMGTTWNHEERSLKKLPNFLPLFFHRI